MRENEHAVIISEEKIRNRITELGREITADYAKIDSPLVIIAMLKGSTYFLADLTREIDLELQFDFISISKIKSSSSSINIVKDVDIAIKDRHVLVLEEIVRSGLTTHYMLEHLESFQPASLNLASLLVNPDQMMMDLPLKYQGFEIDYTRVIGYGMDYKEQFRNLRDIVEL